MFPVDNDMVLFAVRIVDAEKDCCSEVSLFAIVILVVINE